MVLNETEVSQRCIIVIKKKKDGCTYELNILLHKYIINN